MRNFSTLDTVKKMRRDGQVIWSADTETTGFKTINKVGSDGVIDPENVSDRMIEFGATKMIARCDEYGEFSHYEVTDERVDLIFNPERPSDAVHIHGLNDEILKRYPPFREQVETFINLIKDTVVIFHNAPFDVRFIDHELARVGKGKMTDYCEVFDTLFYARNKVKAKSLSLDALTEKLDVMDYRSGYSEGVDADFIAERRSIAGRQDVHSADIDALQLAYVFKALASGVNDLHLGVKLSAKPNIGQLDHKRPLSNSIAQQLSNRINISDDMTLAHQNALIKIGAIEAPEVKEDVSNNLAM
jgi:DNA polymerase III epsilon subunit family exonuclease